MAQDNFIHAKKMVDGLNESFLNHAKVVGESAVQVEKLYNLYVKAPSQMLTMVKSLNAETEKGAQSKKKLSEAEREALRLEKAVTSQREKLKQATSANARELAKLRAETNHKNREATQEGILNSKVIGTYQQLNLQRTQASRRLRDLLASEKASNAEIRRAQVEFNKLDARVRKADLAVRDHTKNVGNYRSALGGLSGQLRTLMSAFGIVGGVMLFARAMRDSLGVIRDFEDQSATLGAILQVNKDQMKGLTDEAIRLGGVTAKTAGEVTGLQIAYARLGFNQKEIIDLTEATINGSIALNAELSETANLVGAMVNTFDEFSTADAPKIIDILSLSTARSALNFEKLANGLPTVAGAANAAGVPFTRLVALLGKLADAGIDTGQSATALRNIFIESAKDGLSYEQILDKIKKSQDQLTASNDEFGKRAAVSATVLANAIDSTKELDEALQDAAGTAQGMADKELDTLSGALTLLQSKWQGLILETDRANGISGILTRTVRFLTTNLERILRVIIYGTGAWIAYRAIMFSINQITRIYQASVVGLRIAKVALSGGIKAATIQMKAFNLASKANPIGLLVGIVTTATAAFLAFRNSVKDSAEELDNIRRKAEEARDAIVDTNISLVKQRIAQLEAESRSEKEAHDKKIAFLRKEIDERQSGQRLMQEFDQDINQKRLDEEDRTQEKIAALIEMHHRKKMLNRVKQGVDERNLIAKQASEMEAVFTPVLEESENQKTIAELKKLLDQLEQTKAGVEGNKDAVDGKRKAVESILEPYQRYIDRLQAVRKEFERLHGIQMKTFEGRDDSTDALVKYATQAGHTTEEVKKLRASVEELQDVFGSLNNSFFNIDFANIGTIFHEIENGFQNAGTAAQAFGQLAIDVFNEITRAQNLNLENQIRNLELQRNVEIEYAGDSAEARGQIEERFNKEKLRLQREQARNSKAMAMMEAIVSTAVAVTKALATPPPGNILLAALVGALGAAQIAVIASQPLPQFKDGVRNFEGGQAIVGDGGKREPITDKSGRLIGISPAKSTLVDLPKGANVYSSEGEFYRELNGLLGSNNIIPIPAGGNSLSREDVYQAMKKAIGDKPSETIVLDKNGFTVSMVRGAVKVNNLNNRVTVRGRNV